MYEKKKKTIFRVLNTKKIIHLSGDLKILQDIFCD